MPWVLTNGKNYLRKNSNQAMKACNNACKAELYPDQKTAERALSNVPKKMQRLGYRTEFINELTISDELAVGVVSKPMVEIAEPVVVEMVAQPMAAEKVTEIETVVAEVERPQHRVPGINETFLNIDEFIAQTSGFGKFLTNAAEQKPILIKAIEQVDMEIMDIEHGIEFSKCNVVGGYQWYKMLREARQRRRAYKDALQCIEYVLELEIKKAEVKNTARRCEGLKHRMYSPRVLTELTDFFKREGAPAV